MAKSRYFFPSHMFTFHLLVQLLLPMVKLNGVSQPINIISIEYKMVHGFCLQAIKIVLHHTNGRFDWLISGHKSVNPSKEVISILSGKDKRFTFVHPVRLHIVVMIINTVANMFSAL